MLANGFAPSQARKAISEPIYRPNRQLGRNMTVINRRRILYTSITLYDIGHKSVAFALSNLILRR